MDRLPGRPPDRPADQLSARLLERCEEAVVVFGPDTAVVSANPAARRLLPGVAVGRACPLPATGAAAWRGEVAGRRLRGRRDVLGDGLGAWFVRDVTDEHGHAEELLVERHRRAFLRDAGRALAATTDPHRLSGVATALAVGKLADWVAFSVPDPEDGRLHTTFGPAPGSALARDHESLGAAWSSPAGAGRVLRTLRHELHPLMDDQLLARLVPAAALPGLRAAGAHCALVLPVPADDLPTVLTLVRTAASGPYTSADVRLAHEYAEHVGSAMRTARLYAERDRRDAVLTAALLPAPLPKVPGARVAAVQRSAAPAQGVGGDFYDMHPCREPGRWAFSVGDVCGRGAAVAVLSSRSRLVLRTATLAGCGPAHRIALLDAEVERGDPSLVMTVIAGTLDLTGPVARVVLTCAGYPPPLVLDAAGRVTTVECTDPLVTGIPGISYGERVLVLPPGTTLLFHNDGVTGARGPGGAEYGESRLRHDLASCAGMPASAVVARLEQRVLEHLCGDPGVDDLVLMALQIPYRDGDVALPPFAGPPPDGTGGVVPPGPG